MKAKRSDQEMGVTCISHNPEDDTTFLVGSESGGIFRCSSNTRGTPASSMYHNRHAIRMNLKLPVV